MPSACFALKTAVPSKNPRGEEFRPSPYLWCAFRFGDGGSHVFRQCTVSMSHTFIQEPCGFLLRRWVVGTAAGTAGRPGGMGAAREVCPTKQVAGRGSGKGGMMCVARRTVQEAQVAIARPLAVSRVLREANVPSH
jgi:hypothetical protein